MSGFTFMCPRARPDEAGAHDITDAMERSVRDSDEDDRVLYCRRCDQAVPLPVVVATTREDPRSTERRRLMTPPARPQPAYEHLELRVDPEPVRRVLDPRVRHWSVALVVSAVVWVTFWALAALLVAQLARTAPRPAPDPSPGPSASAQEQAGAPRDGLSATAPAPQATLHPRVGREGVITHMGRGGWPVEYLAIPLGPGKRVTICGPAACREMVSTDAGPNRERILAGVIADVSWQRFETLCGVPQRMGRCPGSWTIVAGARPTLPATDVVP